MPAAISPLDRVRHYPLCLADGTVLSSYRTLAKRKVKYNIRIAALVPFTLVGRWATARRTSTLRNDLCLSFALPLDSGFSFGRPAALVQSNRIPDWERA